jgi:hypothetical protein
MEKKQQSEDQYTERVGRDKKINLHFNGCLVGFGYEEIEF